MQDCQTHLFHLSVACLFIFGIIATVSIITLSYTGGAASAVWLGMAGLFSRRSRSLAWHR
jgi:hypothetical protein